jgi:hypothetical protein
MRLFEQGVEQRAALGLLHAVDRERELRSALKMVGLVPYSLANAYSLSVIPLSS